MKSLPYLLLAPLALTPRASWRATLSAAVGRERGGGEAKGADEKRLPGREALQHEAAEVAWSAQVGCLVCVCVCICMHVCGCAGE